MFKTSYTRNEEKVVIYRSYKNIILESFLNDLSLNLRNDILSCDYAIFESIFTSNLDKHAPSA